jgi:hypothetical protein
MKAQTLMKILRSLDFALGIESNTAVGGQCCRQTRSKMRDLACKHIGDAAAVDIISTLSQLFVIALCCDYYSVWSCVVLHHHHYCCC